MQVVEFLFPFICAFGAALLFAVSVRRRSIARTLGCSLTAASFGCACAYLLWRIEWFDVWRHGVPPLSYLVGYIPYIVVFGAGGWLLGAGATMGTEVR